MGFYWTFYEAVFSPMKIQMGFLCSNSKPGLGKMWKVLYFSMTLSNVFVCANE